MWISSKDFRKKYGITSQHLYSLRKQGKIKVKKVFDKTILVEDDSDDKKIAVYARVSTPKQKKDLDNQIEFIKKYCIANGKNPEYVFSDIGSGMNEHRHGLNALIDAVVSEKVSEIYISHKDRLTRFGFGYLEEIFNRFGASVKVVNLESDKTFQEELSEDLISIIHYFSMKFYGKRKNKITEIEKDLAKNNFKELDK